MRSLLSLMPHRPEVSRDRKAGARRSMRRWTPSDAMTELEGRQLMTATPIALGAPLTLAAAAPFSISLGTSQNLTSSSVGLASAAPALPTVIGTSFTAAPVSAPALSGAIAIGPLYPTTRVSPTLTLPAHAKQVSAPDPIATSIKAALSAASQKFGLNVQTGGIQYVAFTSANLPSNIAALGLPLRDGVTYYALVGSTTTGASFGGISASPSQGAGGLAVVVDPADPCVYVSAGTGTTFQFGVSAQGLIPFTPHAANYNGPTFSGQLWGSVQGVPVGDLPISVSGDVTIKLDGVLNGAPLAIGQNADTLFLAGGLTQLDLKQIDVGINGALGLSPESGGVSFSIPIAAGSYSIQADQPDFTVVKSDQGYRSYVRGGFGGYLASSQSVVADLGTSVPSGYQLPASKSTTYGPYFSEGAGALYTVTWNTTYSIVEKTTPASFTFAGTTVDPLQGTPLEALYNGSSFGVTASSKGDNATDFLNNFSASLQDHAGLSIAGYSFASNEVDLSVNSQQVTLDVNTSLFDAVDVDLQGSLNLRSGGFFLSGQVGTSNLPLDASASLGFYYNESGHANGLYGSISASFHGDYTSYGFVDDEYGFTVDAQLNGSFFIGSDGSFNANLSIDASATIYVGFDSFGGSIDASASISKHSLSLSFDDGNGDSEGFSINF